MDAQKIGTLIRMMRQKQNLTQLQLAEKLHLSDKTVSKWERGMGIPDVSMFETLSDIFSVELAALLQGELLPKQKDGGNMKKNRFYCCDTCGNIITASADANISCCGYTLPPLTAKQSDETHQLILEDCGDEWYITTAHPMQKDHYIRFIVYQMLDRMLMLRLYPEQDVNVYVPKVKHAKFLFLCSKDGLFEQK